MSNVVDKLADVLPDGSVLCGDAVAERATSYWDSSPTKAKALLSPGTTQEVSEVLRLCHEHKQSVVVQGGLTGVVQGAVSTRDDVIISLEKMNAIESVDALDGVAVIQSGAVLQNVQEQLAEEGFLFPLDLGARGSCTIGGTVATNAGGINVLRYGMMRNLVLGLEVVLADGTVLSSMNQMLKNNTGYDLKQLFIGSEGNAWRGDTSCCSAVSCSEESPDSNDRPGVVRLSGPCTKTYAIRSRRNAQRLRSHVE
jgi:FAD/FMN-containing dehydrogenase